MFAFDLPSNAPAFYSCGAILSKAWPNSLIGLSYGSMAEWLVGWSQQADFALQIAQDLKLSPVTAPHFTLTLTDAQKDLTAGHWKQMYQKSILPQFYHQALDISEIILFNL